MNLIGEHGQSVLAHNSLGWKLLEERRAEMKARIMYKTVNKLDIIKYRLGKYS